MTWNIFHHDNGDAYPPSVSSQVMVGDYLITIGGQLWNSYPSLSIRAFLQGEEILSHEDDIDQISYAAGFTYFEKSLYIFGGGRGFYYISPLVGVHYFTRLILRTFAVISDAKPSALQGHTYPTTVVRHVKVAHTAINKEARHAKSVTQEVLTTKLQQPVNFNASLALKDFIQMKLGHLNVIHAQTIYFAQLEASTRHHSSQSKKAVLISLHYTKKPIFQKTCCFFDF
jgi:hypothetical protein